MSAARTHRSEAGREAAGVFALVVASAFLCVPALLAFKWMAPGARYWLFAGFLVGAFALRLLNSLRSGPRDHDAADDTPSPRPGSLQAVASDVRPPQSRLSAFLKRWGWALLGALWLVNFVVEALTSPFDASTAALAGFAGAGGALAFVLVMALAAKGWTLGVGVTGQVLARLNQPAT